MLSLPLVVALSAPKDVVTGLHEPQFLQVALGALTWASGAGQIQRARVDGTGLVELQSQRPMPSDVAIAAGGDVFWAQWSVQAVGACPSIYAAQALPGAPPRQIVDLCPSRGAPQLAIGGSVQQKLVWLTQGEGGSSTLHRGDVDAAHVVESVDAGHQPTIAMAGTDVYFVTNDATAPALKRWTEAGVEALLPLPATPGRATRTGLALDAAHGQLFWVEAEQQGQAWATKLMRSTLDGGSDRAIVQFGADVAVSGLTVDAARGKLYWVANTNRIQQANLDGTERADLPFHSSVVSDLALDAETQTLFWADAGLGRIQAISLAEPTLVV